jgi:hypothetical protein
MLTLCKVERRGNPTFPKEIATFFTVAYNNTGTKKCVSINLSGKFSVSLIFVKMIANSKKYFGLILDLGRLHNEEE